MQAHHHRHRRSAAPPWRRKQDRSQAHAPIAEATARASAVAWILLLLATASALMIPPTRGWIHRSLPPPPTTGGGASRRTVTTPTATRLDAKVAGLESTPNPSSFLVRLSDPLGGAPEVGSGGGATSLKGTTYGAGTGGAADPPAEIAALLRLDGIESVYAMPLLLTINKRPSAKWESVLPGVLAALGGTQADGGDGNDALLLQGLMGSTASASSSDPLLAAGAAAPAAAGGQVRMRMQVSNGIPVQLEATGFLGTMQRRRLPPRFQGHMEVLMQEGGTSIDFLGGRSWTERGLRYLAEEDDDGGEEGGGSSEFVLPVLPEEQERLELESVLQLELQDVDAAYPDQRLARIVAERLEKATGKGNTKPSPPSPQQPTTTSTDTPPPLDLEAVDRLCDAAERGDGPSLATLAAFVATHHGNVPARRNALAYLGGTGDGGTAANREAVFGAVASAFQNERSPAMRRTAGDALSDLGDSRAVPRALRALGDRSKLVQWRAARILGELGEDEATAAALEEEGGSPGYAFEVAFEIRDALRRVRARLEGGGDDAEGAAPMTGPVWKQIQNAAVSTAKNPDLP